MWTHSITAITPAAQLFRRNDWIIGLVVVLLVLGATVAGALRAVEGVTYDLGLWAAGNRDASERVVVVAIDEPSLERLGPWPWSRYTLAEVNALIGRGNPDAVGYTLPLETPQNEHGLKTLQQLYDDAGGQLDARGRRLFEEAIRAIGTDRVLAASFRRNATVLLGARYSTDWNRAETPKLPSALASQVLPVADGGGGSRLSDWFGPSAPLAIERVHPPAEPLAAAAAAVGLGLSVEPLRQRALHLALPYGDLWLPSLELLLAAQSGAGGRPRIEVMPGAGIRVGDRTYRTASDLAVYPVYYQADDSAPFRVVSAAAVHAREIPTETFRGRVVLIGHTAPELVKPITTAGGTMPPVLAAAHRTSALLQDDLMRVPDWAVWTRLAAFALVAAYLMFLLPRLRLSTGLAVSGLLALVLFGTELFTMLAASSWIPLMAPLTALVGGHAVLGAKRSILNTIAGFQAELSDANRQLGEAHRARGELDEAFRRLRRCRPSDETIDSIYTLGLDYERRRRFAQAIEAFRYCKRHRSSFRDVDERIQRNEQLQNSVALGGKGGANGGATSTLLIGDTAVEKPMLGRFEIERELGRGAMGVVYLGRDPKIGRQVAIKTLALEEEFEAESLQELKDRFLLEAETAGRLDHSHIVAVHDVGEEQDLAWIAMDFLPGEPLSLYAREDNLLPFEEVMEYLIQVADALQFAHEHKVVHRDVKPENVIVDRNKREAVVTDFGVAALVDESRTRSGIVLGTPSFMSPEQLGGDKIDGRSDQFSLAITMYQLLCGQLPFTGDSLTNLMYVIANKPHRDIRRVNPDLPTCASTITNRALKKDPRKRYASAAQMAQALRRCRDKAG